MFKIKIAPPAGSRLCIIYGTFKDVAPLVHICRGSEVVCWGDTSEAEVSLQAVQLQLLHQRPLAAEGIKCVIWAASSRNSTAAVEDVSSAQRFDTFQFDTHDDTGW